MVKGKGKLSNPARGYATTSTPKAPPKVAKKHVEDHNNDDDARLDTQPGPPESQEHHSSPGPVASDPTPKPDNDFTLLATKLSNLDAIKVDSFFRDALAQDTVLARDANDLPAFRLPSDLEHRAAKIFRETDTRLVDYERITANLGARADRERVLSRLDVVYLTLTRMGFETADVEEAMRNTLAVEVADVLDWLCLNLPYERLPLGFVDKAYHEDEMSITAVAATTRPSVSPTTPENTESIIQTSLPDLVPDNKPSTRDSSVPDDIKSWILRSMEADKPSPEDDATAPLSPNHAHATLKLRLIANQKLLATVHKRGDRAAELQAMVNVEETLKLMKELEAQDGFQRREAERIFVEEKGQLDKEDARSKEKGESEALSDTEDDSTESSGLFGSMWEDTPTATPTTTTAPTTVTSLRILRLAHPGWTGKRPQDALLDLCRSQDRRATVKFLREGSSGAHRARCEVSVKGEARRFVMEDGVACETWKEAEGYIATVAMFGMTDLPLYRNLPPPYRDLWLSWQTEKDSQAHHVRLDADVNRFMFLCGLLDLATERAKEDLLSTRHLSTTPSPSDPDTTHLTTTQSPDVDAITPAGKTRRMDFERRKKMRRYRELEVKRAELPIYAYKEEILAALEAHQVAIVSGETGCGKSTQVPQLIASFFLSSGRADCCKIMCTQPRRISAISIARRVSLEMGDDVPGTSRSLVGYQIRLESRVAEENIVVFCTTGILLRRLETDPLLAGVTHVIVDEVHERTLESDFLLIVLQRLMRTRADLRVILMSATLEANRFSEYFGGCPVIEVPGRTFPVEVRFLEDAIEETGYNLEQDSEYALRSQRVWHDEGTVKVSSKHGTIQTLRLEWEDSSSDAYDPTTYEDTLHSETLPAPAAYTPRTLMTLSRLNPYKLNYDLLVALLSHICFPSSSIIPSTNAIPSTGAVLVFLPGLAEIRRLHGLLLADRRFADPLGCIVYPLHSVLASEEQGRVFETPPEGCRKVVLATNVAETGITIPDVTVVLDAGRVRVVRYDEKRGVTNLEETFVSRANAKQRRGRAGRVQAGLCYHLFTQYRYENELASHLAPEMLRLPLTELCLKIMVCRLGRIHDVLASAPDPPPPRAVQSAVDALIGTQALSIVGGEERLTPLGAHLASLPVDVHIGKMILFGSMFRCLDPVLTIAACLSFKSPFVRPFGKEAEADAAREGFRTGNSDLLTMHKAYTAWRDLRRTKSPQERDFCRRQFLSHQNLLAIEDTKKQLLGLLVAIGFVRMEGEEAVELSRNNYRRTAAPSTLCAVPPYYDTRSATITVVNAAVVAGLYPRVVRHSPRTHQLTSGPKEDLVYVHPSSVNFSRTMPTDWVVYYTMVKSSKVYLWETGAVDACPVLMFGGGMEVKHKHRLLTIDQWIKLRCHAKTAVIFKCLRFELNKILQRKIDDPTTDLSEVDQRYLGFMVDILEAGQAK